MLRLLVALLLVAGTGQAAIAVLDTGVDAGHPEFVSVERHTFLEPAPPGGPLADHDGHGTAAASLAAGQTLGTAPGTALLDLQVIPPGQDLDEAGPRTEQAAQRALDWILRQEEPPRVVLLSFAETSLSDEGAATLAAQAARLWETGILVVTPMADGPLAREPRVFTVGATSACQTIRAEDAPLKPDVLAPADELQAAARTPPLGPGGTTVVSGTGHAAAQVAGLAARIAAAHPDMPLDAMTAILRGTAATQPDCPIGILQPDAALAAAAAWEDPIRMPADEDSPGAGLLLVPLLAWIVARRR